jgi:hypothetical protein
MMADRKIRFEPHHIYVANHSMTHPTISKTFKNIHYANIMDMVQPVYQITFILYTVLAIPATLIYASHQGLCCISSDLVKEWGQVLTWDIEKPTPLKALWPIRKYYDMVLTSLNIRNYRLWQVVLSGRSEYPAKDNRKLSLIWKVGSQKIVVGSNDCGL